MNKLSQGSSLPGPHYGCILGVGNDSFVSYHGDKIIKHYASHISLRTLKKYHSIHRELSQKENLVFPFNQEVQLGDEKVFIKNIHFSVLDLGDEIVSEMYLAEDKRKLCVSVIDYCSDNRLKDFGYAPYNNPIIMHLFDVLPEPYNFKRESNFSGMTVDSITKSNIRYKLVGENLYLTATDLGGSINYYVEAYKKKVTDLGISKEP